MIHQFSDLRLKIQFDLVTSLFLIVLDFHALVQNFLLVSIFIMDTLDNSQMILDNIVTDMTIDFQNTACIVKQCVFGQVGMTPTQYIINFDKNVCQVFDDSSGFYWYTLAIGISIVLLASVIAFSVYTYIMRKKRSKKIVTIQSETESSPFYNSQFIDRYVDWLDHRRQDPQTWAEN